MNFSIRQRIFSFVRKAKIKALNKCVFFGTNVYIGPGCTINGIYSLKIGSNVYIGKRVNLEFEGVIGDGVVIANNVGIVGRRDHSAQTLETNFFDAQTVRDDKSLSLFTDIGEGCWIGFGAIILSGVKIGARSIIGAGSIVTKDVPPGSLVVAEPSRVLVRNF